MAEHQIPEDITRWLEERHGGSREAVGQLFSALYDDVKKRAHAALRYNPGLVTVDATDLVNEAFLRLSGSGPLGLKDRRHFLALASRTMRWVLMDTARARKRQRRGGGAQKVTLEEAQVMSESRAEELLALDSALERLNSMDERLVEVVEHRFFGGLTVEETAETLELSPRTVRRDWARARAFLSRELQQSEGSLLRPEAP